MVASVPSLESIAYLKDPASIIGYTLRKFQRTPKQAVPLFEDMIISLPQLIADYGDSPDTLSTQVQAALQTCFNRIFANDRKISVTTSFSMSSDNTYDITVSVMYQKLNGEPEKIVSTLFLKDGRLVIPEDNLKKYLK